MAANHQPDDPPQMLLLPEAIQDWLPPRVENAQIFFGVRHQLVDGERQQKRRLGRQHPVRAFSADDRERRSAMR